MPPKNVKQSKVTPVKKVEEESDNGDSNPKVNKTNSNDSESGKTKTLKKSKNTVKNKKESDNAKDDAKNDAKDDATDNAKDDATDNAKDDATDNAKDEESSDEESDADEKKPKEKKSKESFEELTKKLDTLQASIKDVEKEIRELEKQTDTKEKLRRDYERQVNQISKILLKTHNDEVTKALKNKPKRKGNVNGGFNKEHPVPETLRVFLGLAKDTNMSRPKVMSALNNKFSELGLKNGQTTTLDKQTSKALGFGAETKEIKFTEFQSFLASFYHKEENNE
jgi:hypothetical protein